MPIFTFNSLIVPLNANAINTHNNESNSKRDTPQMPKLMELLFKIVDVTVSLCPFIKVLAKILAMLL